MFETLLQSTFKIYRETSSVYTKAPPVADDSSPSVTITTPDHLEVSISGFSDGTGSVTIDGTDENDNVISEVISFPGNGTKVTSNEFKTVTRVRTSGLADESTTGTLTISMSTSTGADQPTFSFVTDIVGRLTRPSEEEMFSAIGERTTRGGAIITKPDLDVLIGDRVKFASEEWEVKEIQRRFKKFGDVNHWKIIVAELESPAST